MALGDSIFEGAISTLDDLFQHKDLEYFTNETTRKILLDWLTHTHIAMCKADYMREDWDRCVKLHISRKWARTIFNEYMVKKVRSTYLDDDEL